MDSNNASLDDTGLFKLLLKQFENIYLQCIGQDENDPIFNENVFGMKMACVRDQAKSYHAIFFARLATNFR